MMTVVWKEVREHLRWVPLGMAAIVVVICILWRESTVVFNEGRNLETWIGFSVFAIATALGFLQSLPDQRPASRALLLHRGITPQQAFAGKLVAGLLLYGMSVLLPLAGLAIFLSLVCPQYRAGDAAMVLPSVWIACQAWLGWAAALMTVRRQSRFFGSRLLPLLGAGGLYFICAILAAAPAEAPVWIMPTLTVVSVAIFLIAASGSFVAGEGHPDGWRRVPMALVLIVGLTTVAEFLLSLVMVGFVNDHYVPGQNEVVLGPDHRPWAVHSEYVYHEQVRNYAYEPKQAQPLAEGVNSFANLDALPSDWRRQRAWEFSREQGIQSSPSGRFFTLSMMPIEGGIRTQRVWVFDRLLQKVLVYDQRYGRSTVLQNSLGWPESGEDQGDAAMGELLFPRWSVGGVLQYPIVTSRGIFTLLPRGDGIRVHQELPTNANVYAVGQEQIHGLQAYDSQFFTPASSWYGLWYDDRLLEYRMLPPLKNQAPLTQNSIAFEKREFQMPSAFADSSRILVSRDGQELRYGIAWSRAIDPESGEWMAFDENAVVQETQAYQVQWPTNRSAMGFDSMLMMAVASPAPAGLVLWIAYALADPAEAPVPSDASIWKMNATLALSSLFGALLTYLACRRRRSGTMRPSNRWALLGFLLGPLAPLAILAVFPRVHRRRCPHCESRTPVNSNSCESCGQTVQASNLRDVRIFVPWNSDETATAAS